MSTASVQFTFRNVHHDLIEDDVRILFYNEIVSSLSQSLLVHYHGKPVTVADIEGAPQGLYTVMMLPQIYRAKKIQLIVPATGTAKVDEIFCVNPEKVQPEFPDFKDLVEDDSGKELFERLHITRKKYTNLDPLFKAAFFNILAKMKAQDANKTGIKVVDYIDEIYEFRQERFFAATTKDLKSAVQKFKEFASVPGSMHEFEDGWHRVEKNGSFKTTPRDHVANLQLTFATNDVDEWLVDADLDDHTGIEHAFDVLKHKFSGETHPFDIHELLILFQGIDPGYDLVAV